MGRHCRFLATDKMSYLINTDYSLLLVISRFDLSLGFGDKTIREVCEENRLDSSTFLTVVNFLSEKTHDSEKTYEDVNMVSIIRYLKNAHYYFLDYKLPAIRSKLIRIVDASPDNAPFRTIFLKFFDDYYQEVKKHMDYENNVVFPYTASLSEGKLIKDYNIAIFEQKHDQIDQKMSELKNILIKYYPSRGSDHLLTEVLFDIFACETDLLSHNEVEDLLFVPAVRAIELKLQANEIK